MSSNSANRVFRVSALFLPVISCVAWVSSTDAAADVHRSRLMNSKGETPTLRIQAKTLPCSETRSLEAHRYHPRPVPIRHQVPVLAKGSAGDGSNPNEGAPFPSKLEKTRFSRMPYWFRVVRCLARWGSLSSCRLLG